MRNCLTQSKKFFFKNGVIRYPLKSLKFLFIIFFSVSSSVLFAQQIIKGRVSVGDTALVGATVQIKGANISTQTDANGSFTISAPSNAKLVITSVGYSPEEVSVGNRSTINVQLRSSASELGEVVVVGYGTQRKSDLTGAVGTVNIAKSMTARPVTNVQELLASAVPGLNIAKSSGAPGSGASINIRGISTIGGSSGVLILIDGFPGNIYSLNPNDVESISVLKDAASAAIYGSRAANGVLLVTTKKGKNIGKPVVEVNSSISFQKPQFQIDFVGSADYMKLWDQMLINDGKPTVFGVQGLADLAAGKYADNSW